MKHFNLMMRSECHAMLPLMSPAHGIFRSESGYLRYLASLTALGPSSLLRTLHPITSLRLQSDLYALTSPGGPYYAPRAVQVGGEWAMQAGLDVKGSDVHALPLLSHQAAAMSTLDAAYPLGRSTRRVVRTFFR
jgi:hypothetical protein